MHDIDVFGMLLIYQAKQLSAWTELQYMAAIYIYALSFMAAARGYVS